jgi:prophage maintenance system killer protein
VDGNKRTALYLVELLVQRSGYEFVEGDAVTVEFILSVATGETGYEELAEWFSERIARTGVP